MDSLWIGLINPPGYKHDVKKHSASHRQKGTILEVTAGECLFQLKHGLTDIYQGSILLH